MKNLIHIILVISLTGFLALNNINTKGPVDTIINQSNIKPQNLSGGITINYLKGSAISYYNLNNLFINNDLYGFNFGILMPKYDFPWRSHHQPFGLSYPFGLKGGEIEMVSFPKMSNSDLKKSRMEYYAVKRRVDSLENKVNDFKRIVDTGKRQKVKVDKVTREKTIVIEKLTDVQVKDTKRKLVAAEFQLMVAKDELKEKDFGFSQATGAISDKISNSKQAYKKKKADDKIESVKALMNSAVLNGNLQAVVDVQNLAANGGDIKRIKSELMKIVRKENKSGYPIKNLSFKAVEIIMAGLLNWNSDKSEQPFPIS